MLIRSQDKLKLISMDGIKYLEIEQGFSVDDNTVWAVCGDDEATVIGVYSTQEKAQAVLDEIMYTYARNKNAEYFQAGIPNSNYVFEMPADDDPWFDRKDEPEEEPREVTFSFRCKEVNNG